MFSWLVNVRNIEIDTINAEYLTTTEGMFSENHNLISVSLPNITSSNLVNTNSMFWDCFLLEQIDLSNFDMSKVSQTTDMLSDLDSLTSLVTPIVMCSTSITLPKTLYDTSNNSYTLLNVNTPTNIVLETN